MEKEIVQGLLIPFLGTALGAACVFFVRGELNWRIHRAFTGFAAGVMVAASIWSLLIPAMEESGFFAGCHWFLGRHFIFAAFGSSHSPSAP